MTKMDLKYLSNLFKLAPDDLEDQQKEDLCQHIKWFDIDVEDLDFQKLKHLFKLTQEVMKYKDEQVESLITEFDEIARKQGVEEAKLIQNLEQEIKSLRSSSGSRRHTPDIGVIKENEDLKKKLRNCKSNMKIQNQEVDKLKKNISILQEEKILLHSEIQAVQRDSDSQSEASEIFDKNQQFTENIRQKNKHISQLLSDIEIVEKENVILKEKIIILRDELDEATQHITNITTEITGQNNILKNNKDKIELLIEEKEALHNQIEELVIQKQDQDIHLENFSQTLDNKVDELKNLLYEKQTEIKDLNHQNREFELKLSQYAKSNISLVPATVLLEREEQIEELQSKLTDAIQEIEKNTVLFNNLAETQSQVAASTEPLQIIEDLKSRLETSHKRCQELQNQLVETERDAQNQGEQLTELLTQLRKYEDGQYGLSDALREIQEFRVQLNIRDKQISDLIQTSNKLQYTCDDIEQDNLTLREKLGLPLDIQISKHGTVSKQKKQKKLINNLQNQIEILDDEKLQMKVEIQNLRRQITNVSVEIDNKKVDIINGDVDYQKQFVNVVDENEALRKGMHEILESIRTKNDSSRKEVKSQTLEQLLQILDARHVTGWYHPSMRLQAEINTLQGSNDELRNQLKLYRTEINESNDQLKDAQQKIIDAQNQIPTATFTAIDNSLIASLSIPPNISSTSADIISKLNSHLLTVLNEYHTELENNDQLNQKFESTKQEINVFRQQVGLLYNQYIEEKKILINKNREIETDKLNLLETIQMLQQKLATCIDSSGSTVGLNLTNDLIRLNRKCVYLEENEKKFSNENLKLKSELCYAKSASSEFIKDLEIVRNNLNYKVSILERSLRDSVPKTKLEMANKTIYDLTVKYNELLQNINNFKDSNDVLIYKKEIELLYSEKEQIQFALVQLKSACPGVMDSDILCLQSTIANLEVKFSTEKQRANHINSLYELVKDQLRKSEERYFEIDNQNKTLLNANLKLQLVQQDLQDKLTYSSTREDFNRLDEKYCGSQQELVDSKNKYEKLLIKYNVINNEIKTREIIKATINMELINMKHLLLDLQSNSDEKALIARLGTEVVLARICESDAKNKLEILSNELKQINEDRKQKEVLLEESNAQLNNVQNQMEMKIRIFEQIIHSLRTQYLGCSPLSTQERVLSMFIQIFDDKHTAFNELQIMQKDKSDLIILQEQLNIEMKNCLELKNTLLQTPNSNIDEKIFEWYKDKNTLQLSEIRVRRHLEIKESQLQQTLIRLKKQDTQLAQLEEELLKISNSFLNNNSYLSNFFRKKPNETCSKNPVIETSDIGTDPHITNSIKNTIETQTAILNPPEDKNHDAIIHSLKEQIRQAGELISLKESNLDRQQSLISNLEKNIESLKVELNHTLTQVVTENVAKEVRQQVNVIDEVDMEEHNALKHMVTKLQLMISQKEDLITKYESLLKEGRDEHSLAASRFQDEIKQLQTNLQKQQQAYKELETIPIESKPTDLIPNRNAIEQYVNQVHILEEHMADLQTSVSSLNSQLQASRQEAVRWRTLANDRLNSIENLRKEFIDQYEEEISTYKSESDKYKEENLQLKQDITKSKVELNQKNSNISQQIQERDTKMHELQLSIMDLQNELKIQTEDVKTEHSGHVSELELEKQLLEREHDALKKRFEQVSSREKCAREEIRNLRGQFINRPVHSKGDRSDRTMKEQLQKKVALLEKELNEAKERLEKEAAINDARKIKITEDFTLWEKQKKWQNIAEKCKEKLTIKQEEFEKIQQSYSSAKAIISRLEREKHILEGKLKMAKSITLNSNRQEVVEDENVQLKNEIDLLTAKLEMQQYHSGGLGAAMLQEKLEAQERKIAVLELSAKGTLEVTAELERLNNSVVSLQKANLRLEAENLELNLDLRRVGADAPFLKDQIQHLERYIDVLKSEQSEHHVTDAGDQPAGASAANSRKVQELEKTVLSLKRAVEKLQAENKRLHSRPCSSTTTDRKVFSDKHQLELKQLKEQYGESVQKSVILADELTKTQKRVRFLENFVEAKQIDCESTLNSELTEVKAQLAHKSQLLEKVKILLQKAAIKERFLKDQVEQLKEMIATSTASEALNNGEESGS